MKGGHAGGAHGKLKNDLCTPGFGDLHHRPKKCVIGCIQSPEAIVAWLLFEFQ